MINRKPCQCYYCRKTIEKHQPKKRVHKQNFAHKDCERKSKLTSEAEDFLNSFEIKESKPTIADKFINFFFNHANDNN